MILPPVHAIFFDAVGTLIHPEPPAPEVYQAVGQRYGSAVALADIRRRFSAAFHEEDALDRAVDWRTSEASEVERWRRIVGAVLDDVSDPVACFRELFEHFSRAEAWRCDRDTESVLKELAARGYRLGMASNYDERLRSVAAGLPALRPIQHLVISSEVGWRKPAGQFFGAICEAIRLPPEQVLYVGDDPANDFAGARAAGLQAVLFDAADQHPDGVARIHQLSELSRLLPKT
ncbi:MAG TPA: HAD-IA family hydrolase [Gemmataceae bacterium]|nr:HAD-IA family hydrolase [Gemmataceae bacterium]